MDSPWDMLQLNKHFDIVSILCQIQPWLMFHSLVNSLHILLTVLSYFRQLQCLSPDGPLDCCLRMLIKWTWENQGPKWTGTSFHFYEYRAASFVFSWAFEFCCLLVSPNSILWPEVYILALVSITQCVSIPVLSQSSEFLSSESKTSHAESGGMSNIRVWAQVSNRRTLENHESHACDWIKVGVRPPSDLESKCKMWQIWARLCLTY